MECHYRTSKRVTGTYCPFTTILRSIKTFDPSDPMYFTPGNWKFLPDSDIYHCGIHKYHKCAGRRVGIKKRTVRPTVRAAGKTHQFLTCPDTVDSD